jgi:dTDP-4-dehydrorhamnose reductase
MAPPNGPHHTVTILVTGAAGQVGREVVRALGVADLPFEALGREDLDIRDRAAVDRAVQEIRPALLVNCAAYTSVDGAEDAPDAALAVNALGARYVAEACAGSGLPLVHFSTDYVFSGATNRPWVETDAPAPVNVYGASKLDGEEHIRRANPRHLILRTSWVFGVHGSNFVRSILEATRRGAPLEVVRDQRGCPTPASWLGDTVAELAPAVMTTTFSDWGTYHLCGTPSTTWFEFARAIQGALPESQELQRVPVHPVSGDSRGGATRPPDSTLDMNRARRVFGLKPPLWEEALPGVVAGILAGDGHDVRHEGC